jgi:hypothetical protein
MIVESMNVAALVGISSAVRVFETREAALLAAQARRTGIDDS